LEVVVVDNASPDGTPDMVEREFPAVRLIRAESNMGFAAGNNRAIAACHGRYVMLLNPDAELLPGTLETCLARFDSDESVSVVAPKIVNPDGSLQYSLRNFPTAGNAVFEALLLHRFIPRATVRFGEMIVDAAHYEDEKRPQWASGAAFMTREDVLEDVGGLDERYFLFCEETDWFLRVHELGLKTLYVPDAVVVHRSSQGRNPELMYHAVRSRLLYASENLAPLSAAIVKAVLVLGVTARFAGWAALGWFGQAGATERSRAYRAGLRAVVRPGSRE